MANVSGQLADDLGQFTGTTDVAPYNEALVQTHEVFNKGLLDQIVANRDADGIAPGTVQCPVDQCRIHHDVAMVRNEQIRAIFKLIQPFNGQVLNCGIDDLGHERCDFVLQIFNGVELFELTF